MKSTHNKGIKKFKESLFTLSSLTQTALLTLLNSAPSVSLSVKRAWNSILTTSNSHPESSDDILMASWCLQRTADSKLNSTNRPPMSVLETAKYVYFSANCLLSTVNLQTVITLNTVHFIH